MMIKNIVLPVIKLVKRVRMEIISINALYVMKLNNLGNWNKDPALAYKDITILLISAKILSVISAI